MRSVVARAGIVAAIAGLAAAFAPGGAVAAPACRTAVSPGDESALTAMINQARRANGVAKVAGVKVLKVAGRKKSLAMAKGGTFAHASSGKLPWAAGRAAGQNIAMASSAGVAFQAMLASPGHRQNLLARSWRYTGVGVVARCDGMRFFTINLMAR